MVWIIRKGWFLSNLSGEIPVMYQILLRIISWFQIKFSYFLHKSTFYTSSSLHHLAHSLDLLKWKINLKFHTFWPIPPLRYFKPIHVPKDNLFCSVASEEISVVMELVSFGDIFHKNTFFTSSKFLYGLYPI